MALKFGPRRTIVNGFTSWYAKDQRVWMAYISAGVCKIELKSAQGYKLDSTINVDAATANLTGVPLNEPICLDPVTGRLHLLYAANENAAGSPCVLYHKSSDDNGATWTASPHTLDDGVAHGNGRFYRLGVVAYNGYLTAVYTSEANITFTTDGLYEVHSSDGGATWSAPAKLYTSPVCPFEPNIDLGADATVHISWYDPGSVTNAAGAMMYAQGAFNGAGWTWQGSPTTVAPLSEAWGRPRIISSNGVVLIIGNTNWGGSLADVGLIRSTDNGATWGSTQTLATHTGSNYTDHPWAEIDSDKAAVVWVRSGSPITYEVVLSTDAGATWGSPITPLTTAGNSDAPKLLLTKDLLVMIGYDNTGPQNLWAAYPLFAPDPVVTAIVDAFDRANENPLSDGGKWSAWETNQLKLVTNAVTRQLAAGSFDRSGSYRNDYSFTGSCEVYGDVPTNGGEVDFWLMTAKPSLSGNGYVLSTANGDMGTNLSIDKYVNGAFSVTLSGLTEALAAGNKFLLRLDPACVSVMRYVSGDWEEILRGEETTYRTSLLHAVDIAGSAGAPVVDNVGGGLIYAPENVTAPVVTGTVSNGQTLSTTYGTWVTTLGKTPTRYTFQWQQSTDGGSNWTNITRANLRFYKIGTTSGLYRVQVTAINSLGSTTVTSNVVGTPIFPTSDVAAGGWTPSTGTDLFAMVDDIPSNDAQYIQSNTGAASDAATLGFGTLRIGPNARIVVRHKRG